jgi:hypothetical protein
VAKHQPSDVPYNPSVQHVSISAHVIRQHPALMRISFVCASSRLSGREDLVFNIRTVEPACY